MELSRKLGIVIVCGIPAIVGSGFFWELSENWIVVYGYLFLLAVALLVLLFAPRGFINYSQIWETTSGRIRELGSKLQKLFSGA